MARFHHGVRVGLVRVGRERYCSGRLRVAVTRRGYASRLRVAVTRCGYASRLRVAFPTPTVPLWRAGFKLTVPLLWAGFKPDGDGRGGYVSIVIS